jgi:protein involved in polysaccharide export with SLBB domain
LDARLTELLSSRLQNPEVTVIVTDLRPPLVYVLGEVGQPRAVPLREALTAVQAVASAGGFTVRSKEKSVIIVRLMEDNRLMAIPVQVEAAGRGARYIALSNVPLQADDVVFVPKKAIAKLNVFLTESVNPLLSTVNSMFSTYTNFKLIEVLEQNVQAVQNQDSGN